MGADGADQMMVAMSQVIGLMAGAALAGDVERAAWVAGNAERYNRQVSHEEKQVAKTLAEKSDGRWTAEDIENSYRVSAILDEGIYPNTAMLATKDQIHDLGGVWIESGIEGMYIQLLPNNIDPEMIKFMATNTEGYSWSDHLMGLKPESNGKAQVLDYTYPGCIACVAGLPYDLNTGDLRSVEQQEADRRALTLGLSSLVAAPLGGATIASYGLRSFLMGAGLGAGFDGIGQAINGEDYRLGQSVIAGATGGLAYPLANSSVVINAILGATVGGANTSINNAFYNENADVIEGTSYGALAGIGGGVIGKGMSTALGKILPGRISEGVIDPNKSILLQNIGILNPYPAYIGEISGQITNGGIPLILQNIKYKQGE